MNNTHRWEYLPVFSGGLLSGILISGAIETFLQNGLLSWIYDHETLTAGFIAILAAGLAYSAAMLQVRSGEKIARDIRVRELRAAKSMMPFALSQMTDYAQESLKLSLDMALGHASKPSMPEMSAEILSVFRDCIEKDDTESYEKIYMLMKEVQIQRARLKDEIRRYNKSDGDMDIYLGMMTPDERMRFSGGHGYSSVMILLIVQELWGFARENKDHEEERLRKNRVDSIFMFLNADENTNYEPENWQGFVDHLKETVDKRYV
tara:strand:- start:65934 stop:66722 length:789 start_codon:yes stop_codon:yes gene_type:complete